MVKAASCRGSGFISIKMEEKNNLVLENVTLAAIVRDEMINLAGGVVDFVNRTVPHVERAVILDTGSRDGTYETLLELERKHGNLEVGQISFENGYGPARNETLARVATDYAFVLDADERLTKRDFTRLKEEVEQGHDSLTFTYLCIEPNGADRFGGGHNPRLFLVESTHFSGSYGERLFKFNRSYSPKFPSSVEIKHFVPTTSARMRKTADWYVGKRWENGNSPSSVDSYDLWHTPARDDIFSDTFLDAITDRRMYEKPDSKVNFV